ncbi:MAG: hypothetical protein QXN26_06760 [Thermoplasmataceae archaeon]
MNSTNPDIRGEVDESRGLLKKIQLVIPGFRGYRQLDDLRVADAMLRKQVSSLLQVSENRLQDARSSMVSSGNFQMLTQIASILSQMQQFEGELLHSEQGYSGISPAIRINSAKLNSLYEYDYAFLQGASDAAQLCDFSKILESPDQEALSGRISAIKENIQKMKYSWEQRIITVENIKQVAGGSV